MADINRIDEIPEAPQWWEVQNIPTAMIRELRRRKNSNNIGFKFPTSGNPSAIVSNFYKNHGDYKGPMTPWVRIFSNGTGLAGNGLVPISKILEKNGKVKVYNGFLMMPGEGFYDAFGYRQNGNALQQNISILGYEADGTPHYIDPVFRNKYSYKWPSNFLVKDPNGNFIEKISSQKSESPSILPPPNLESLEVRTSKDMLAYATIKFKCYGLAQLEYLAPFFLTPRLNVFVEFGWNLFNVESLINLNNENECWSLIERPQKVVERWYKSYGNYGCITGIITKYEFSSEDGQVFNCTTELTSRQAMYAGMPVENNVTHIVNTTNNKKVPVETNEYTGLKTFIKNAFPKIKQVVENESNFMEYIASTLSGQTSTNNNTTYNGDVLKFAASKEFYGGKKENRIFIGRSRQSTVYKKSSVPNGTDRINYASPKDYQSVSYINAKDFDYENNNKVWVQLDFLFEVVNKFCSVEKNKTFTIDVDKIINAHPNLISCDPNVLIPNGIAPKFNIGRISANQTNLNNTIRDGIITKEEALQQAALGGYLPEGSVDDAFLKSVYDLEINESDPLFPAAKKVQTVFKTEGAYRDNLDTVINRLYYDIGNVNESDPQSNISFPFVYDKTLTINKENVILTDPTKSKQDVTRTYEKHRYGNLKNLYLSVDKIVEISENKSITTLQQFTNAILNTINDSVNGFWKFQISQADTGGLSIVDNNNANIGFRSPNLNSVYVFDVGGTESCIKNISLNTSLTSEQATLTLFQAGQNRPVDSNTIMSLVTTDLPSITYFDRLDKFQTTPNSTTGQNNTVPSQNDINVDQNPLIAKIQTYGSADKTLLFTLAYLKSGNDNPDSADKNYKQLNLHPDLKGKLMQVLDDGDFENNLPLYSGISPNFQITVTFDGIFGFRMFQHFGISNFPKPYIPENVIFMITDVTHNITEGGGKWETVVTCLARCVLNQKIKYYPV